MIGHEFVCVGGQPWRRVHGALFPMLPPHLQPRVAPDAMRRELAAHRAHFARWDEGFESDAATEWWHVIKDGPATADDLPKKVRYMVRQGLKHYLVDPCSKEDVLAEGYDVYCRAYDRYDTFERRYQQQEFVDAVARMPDNIEFWCAREQAAGGMVAFAENVVYADACFYSTMWFCPDALKRGASYALIQAMNEHYLADRGFRYVSDGARNLSHQTNIHSFLQSKFGFRRAYCRLRVVYSRPVGLLVRLSYPFRSLVAHLPGAGPLRVLLEQERIRRACDPP